MFYMYTDMLYVIFFHDAKRFLEMYFFHYNNVYTYFNSDDLISIMVNRFCLYK